MIAQWLNVHLASATNPYGCWFMSHAPLHTQHSCLWAGITQEDVPDPWDSAAVWDTQKNLLASGFRLAQSSSSHYSHLVSEQVNGRFLTLLLFKLFFKSSIVL